MSAWAGPATVLGLAWGLLGGGRPRWDRERSIVVLSSVRGIPGAGMDRTGAAGATVGQAVLCRSATPTARLLDHEALHARQFERLGPFFPVVYGWWLLRHGYRSNPFEIAARQAASNTPS